jgi:hypothetical protein
MQYGPPADVSCVSELYEDDLVEDGIQEEPAKNRFVGFAVDNDTAEEVASKFEINVAKLLYDNTKSTKLLTKVRRLLAFTPIVIPIRWGGSIHKNLSCGNHKAITKQERKRRRRTPGYEKLLPPPVL